MNNKSPSDICFEFLTSTSLLNSKVLDVGFGEGRVMRRYRKNGHTVYGLEIESALVRRGIGEGFDCTQGFAEELPYPNNTFDTVVSSVVLPYTKPQKSISEMVRVLKPGGSLRLTTHSFRYGLNLLSDENYKMRIYGARMIVNSWVYYTTNLRLPGFLGDTLCTSADYLERKAKKVGLKNIECRFAGESDEAKGFLLLHAVKPN
jgi:ubiquinone/menaquinone biosynthesis C-methylase UbiE